MRIFNGYGGTVIGAKKGVAGNIIAKCGDSETMLYVLTEGKKSKEVKSE